MAPGLIILRDGSFFPLATLARDRPLFFLECAAFLAIGHPPCCSSPLAQKSGFGESLLGGSRFTGKSEEPNTRFPRMSRAQSHLRFKRESTGVPRLALLPLPRHCTRFYL